MKISVIVPVYRVPGALLRACVESLLRQTLDGMEFLFVVDGEDDPSLELLQAAARRDSRIHLWINPQRQGVSAARNRGLEMARGEWVGFVDADDRVEPDMYAELVSLARNQACDLVGCGFAREAADGAVRLDCPAESATGMETDLAAARAYENAKTSCCSKLFRKAAIAGLRFRPELTHMEDAVFLTEALGRARRVGFTSKPLYHVRHRGDSAHRRRMTIEGFERVYRALACLARLGAERSAGTRWMRRFWAWRLLAWSVAARRYHDELPPDCRERALGIVRQFYGKHLAAFRETYPAWLRYVLERQMEDAERFFVRPGFFYTLLWNRIRIGLAPATGRGLVFRGLKGRRRAVPGGRT